MRTKSHPFPLEEESTTTLSSSSTINATIKSSTMDNVTSQLATFYSPNNTSALEISTTVNTTRRNDNIFVNVVDTILGEKFVDKSTQKDFDLNPAIRNHIMELEKRVIHYQTINAFNNHRINSMQLEINYLTQQNFQRTLQFNQYQRALDRQQFQYHVQQQIRQQQQSLQENQNIKSSSNNNNDCFVTQWIPDRMKATQSYQGSQEAELILSTSSATCGSRLSHYAHSTIHHQAPFVTQPTSPTTSIPSFYSDTSTVLYNQKSRPVHNQEQSQPEKQQQQQTNQLHRHHPYQQ